MTKKKINQDKFTYLSIPHDPGPKPAGIKELRVYLQAHTRIRLKSGEKVGEDFLSKLEIQMTKDAGNELTDFLYSVDRLLVVSLKVRKFLEDKQFGSDEIEYIPFKLKDKKGKLLTEQYCVVNPLLKITCLDTEKSDCNLFTNPVDGSQRWNVESIVVREEAIPPELRLFRLAEDTSQILIRSDLLAAIKKAKFTGLVARLPGDSLTKIFYD
jgi:hypothetical protein